MTKSYPVEVVLSATTGVLLKHHGFDELHELAEHVLGHPVWTHEFADAGTVRRLRDAVLAQHPALRDAEPWAPDGDLAAYLAGYVERARARYGATLEVEAGTGERTESPLASMQRLAPDKPIVVVVDRRRS